MKRTQLLALLFLLLLTIPVHSRANDAGVVTQHLHGAGATFPLNIYNRWILNFFRAERLLVKYDGVGSGAGVKSIMSSSVDFGASDRPLAREQLDAAGLIQIPMVLGGLAVVVNLPGIEDNSLRLSGELLAEIYRGDIKNWNDLRIASLNPKLTLPDLSITPIHRKRKSGSTWLFTTYLGNHNSDWKRAFGAVQQLEWPAGKAAVGTSGMASAVRDAPGAIGYVDFSTSESKRLNKVLLDNRSGNYVAISHQAIQAASEHADWYRDASIVDMPGADVWPISAVTFILLPENRLDRTKKLRAQAFISWCLKDGERYVDPMGYIPLPDEAISFSLEQLNKL